MDALHMKTSSSVTINMTWRFYLTFFFFINILAAMILSMITVVNCLEPLIETNINEEIKNIIGKYVSKIPDIKSRFVINDELSKVINHYFKGKITTFPLYKISLTIDRNPVKIPWSLGGIDENQLEEVKERQYKLFVPKKKLRKSKKLVTDKTTPTTPTTPTTLTTLTTPTTLTETTSPPSTTILTTLTTTTTTVK